MLQLMPDVLGPAAPSAGLPGSSWYSIPNPVDGITPTNFYLVAPPPPADTTKPTPAAEIGLGVMKQIGYGGLTISAYGYVPLFNLRTDAAPSLLVGARPSHVGVSAAMSGGAAFSTQGGVTFTTMALDCTVNFSSAPPTMNLVFGGVKGAPGGLPCADGACTFATLA